MSTKNVMRIYGRPVFCTSDLNWSSEVQVLVFASRAFQMRMVSGKNDFWYVTVLA